VDETSGRFKIPEPYAEAYKKAGIEDFYITSEDGERALVFPIAEWELKEKALAMLSPSHPVRQKYLDVTGSYGQEVKKDSQGRLVIPQLLREDAGLKGEVVVIGTFGQLEPGYLQVVNADRLRTKQKANPITNDDKYVVAEVEAKAKAAPAEEQV